MGASDSDSVFLQWYTVNAEIKNLSDENSEPSNVLFLARSRVAYLTTVPTVKLAIVIRRILLL